MSLNKTIILIVFIFKLVNLGFAESNFFIPNRCPQIGGAMPSRFPDEPKVSGCVCFYDGRCEYRNDKGMVDLCYYSGANSINQNEQCPILNGGTMNVCPHKPIWPPSPVTADADESSKEETANLSIRCSSYAKQGCVCYQNGTCIKSSNVNKCVNCQDDNIISVVEDGDCPVKALPATNSTCTLKTSLEAYKCTEDDRSPRKICPMYIMRDGCVCYQDGTCRNSSTNSCTNCRNANVVSVLQGKNCTCL